MGVKIANTILAVGFALFTLLSASPEKVQAQVSIGDGNADLINGVTIDDLKTVLSHWLATTWPNNVNPDQYQDGKINALDFTVVVKRMTPAGPTISSISDNYNCVVGPCSVPKYEKFEITFQINTVASNPQLPYDPTTYGGSIIPGSGVTVDALFTSPGGQTYTQPAFYFQEFDDQVKGNEWFYPTGNFSWKVRFAPNQEGTWRYRLGATDGQGSSPPDPEKSFTVVPSNNKGFIRVSSRDSRYFEFEDGTYFPALGYNMNFNHVNWVNPKLDNESYFQTLQNNGIQLIRIWLSQWSIFTSAWNDWAGQHNRYDGYIPRTGLTQFGSPITIKMKIAWNHFWFDDCIFMGFTQPHPAVKQNTDYRVRVNFRAFNITGPRIANLPYGFVAKMGDWLPPNCAEPGTGTTVTAYSRDTADFVELTGTWNSGANDFLPFFYLALENVNSGDVYIDSVSVEEIPGGQNIISKPSMNHHLYMTQRNSYALDKVLDLAKGNNVYLKPVILEKNEDILNWIDYQGNFGLYSNDNFYGDYRRVTAVRFLQQAWWRYLQARWGYSQNIHSWELLNEGDPFNDRHYTQTDELGRFMRQFAPNHHLVSTSTWHSFPTQFWGDNNNYGNVDFADIHQYIPQDADPNFYDSALATKALSDQIGAKTSGGANKPTIRGETGLVDTGSEPPTVLLNNDKNGIWLHNYIWGGINSGGLIESYWYERQHIDGQYPNFIGVDLRPKFKSYFDFLTEPAPKNIPLNNGQYIDVQATASNPEIRAWGQKDTITNKAHLWISNRRHTWCAAIGGVSGCPTSWDSSTDRLNGTVTLSGFSPNTLFNIEWWQFDNTTALTKVTGNVSSNTSGQIFLDIGSLPATITDAAVKIFP